RPSAGQRRRRPAAASRPRSHRRPRIRRGRPAHPGALQRQDGHRGMTSVRKSALRALLFVASLALWEAAVRILKVPAFILPPPSAIGAALVRGAASGIYLQHFFVTLAEPLLGFALGSAVAFVFGMALAASPLTAYLLSPYIVMFQSVPEVARAPLVDAWFPPRLVT